MHDRHQSERIDIIEKIIVVDSIMGSGKTTAVLNKIKEDKDGSYIYVTPYLPEVERVIKETSGRFRQPKNTGEGKLSNFHELLSSGEDIVTTHALFLRTTPKTAQLINEGKYTLVLDETLNILQEYNEVVNELDNKAVTKGDVRWLLQEGYIAVTPDDYTVSWTGSSADDFHYSEVERLSKSGCLRCIDDTLFWEFPVEVFRAFEQAYILTYLFGGSMLASYLKSYGFEYEKCSARNTDGVYHLCEYTDPIEFRTELSGKINIYRGMLNECGKRHNAFSVNWLQGRSAKQIKDLQNAMRNYKDSLHAKSCAIMWTTIKQGGLDEKLSRTKGFKYIHKLSKIERNLPEHKLRSLLCFVPCTTRATNDFSDRTTLLYLINRYMSPEVEKYFIRRGFPVDRELFATGEMLQWIWRSAIRKGQPINIYIPSLRMRKLLSDWLGVSWALSDEVSPKTLEKTA